MGKLRKIGSANPLDLFDQALDSLEVSAASTSLPSVFLPEFLRVLKESMAAEQVYVFCSYRDEYFYLQATTGSSEDIPWDSLELLRGPSGRDAVETSRDVPASSTRIVRRFGTDPSLCFLVVEWGKGSHPRATKERESIVDGFVEVLERFHSRAFLIRLHELQSTHASLHGMLTDSRRRVEKESLWVNGCRSLFRASRVAWLEISDAGAYGLRALSDCTNQELLKRIEPSYSEFMQLHQSADSVAVRQALLRDFAKRQGIAYCLVMPIDGSEIPEDGRDQVLSRAANYWLLEWSDPEGYQDRVDCLAGFLPNLRCDLATTSHIRPKSQRVWRRLAAVLATIVALAFLARPIDFWIEAEGKFYPERYQVLYIPSDGFIKRQYAKDGDSVRAGDVILMLDSPSLLAQSEALESEARAIREKKNGLSLLLSQLGNGSSRQTESDLQRTAMEISELSIRQKSLEQQKAIVDEEINRLAVSVQMAGTLIMSSLDVNRGDIPVRRGDPVAKVFDTDGPWIVEADIADIDLAYLPPKLLDEGREVTVMPSNSVSGPLHGTMDHIASSMRNTDAGPVLDIIVRPESLPDRIRPGMGVSIKLHAGSKPQIYVWLRPFWDRMRQRFWNWPTPFSSKDENLQ
jgi:biotin carboxyl carrier protein